eukprot:CAMPEP_0202893362 /NCGR_PEP_ID=MMETSP1392-20130828/2958_1 /ASSEMBLY_ACC=CAM_ASM_000868 /TAXON_ID=225041 /ORGANISM="Chlamydomonas chlamydogama, Strain SAG 11-48b" /LENGTH=662 /DNA_ID=CAMNT_0049577667 /DNA_START=510 /DNA_END=2498 /DNA_ORIENTATION=-
MSRTTLQQQHYRVALSRLGALVEDEPPSSGIERQHVQALLELLTAGLMPLVSQLGTQQLVSTACSLAKLHYYDGPLLKEVFEESWRHVPNMKPWQAAGMLWAFARYHFEFKLPVSPDWTDALLQQLQHAGFSECSPSTLSQTIYACAMLQHRPADAWMSAYLAHTQLRLPEYGARDISTSLWSLATLQLEPGREWVDAALARSEQVVRSFSNGTMLASTLWALAVLKHQPPASWMTHFLWQVQRMLKACDAQNLSNIAWALATLQYRPDNKWMQQFLRCAGQRMGMSTAPGQAGRAASQQASACAPQAYANLLWALAKLQVRPTRLRSWLRALCGVTMPRLLHFPARDLTSVVWSLQRLRYMPDADWMLEAQVAMQARLPQFDLTSLVVALVALGRFSQHPSSTAEHGRLDKVDEALILRMCGSLTPMIQAAQSSGGVSMQTSVSLVVAFAKLRVAIPQELHDLLLRSVAPHLQDLPPRQLSNVCYAVCQLAQTTGSMMHLRAGSEFELLPRLAHLSQSYMASWQLNGADLAQLVTGFTRMGYNPGEAWLAHHEACCSRLMRQDQLSRAQAAAVFRAYRSLQYAPRHLAAVLRSRQVRAAAIADAMAGSSLDGETYEGAEPEGLPMIGSWEQEEEAALHSVHMKQRQHMAGSRALLDSRAGS